MTWQQLNEETHAFVGDYGKIIGLVVFEKKYNYYIAYKQYKLLGYYIDLTRAKAAAMPSEPMPAKLEPEAMPWDS